MKFRQIFMGLILIFALAACSGVELPFQLPELPASGASTQSPPGVEGEPSGTPAPSRTPGPTPTPTIIPRPTRKSPYPVSAGTAVLDIGFQAIKVEDLPALQPVLSIPQKQIWQSAPSTDGQKIFVSTSNGVYVYQVNGDMLANWPDLFTISAKCESCISVNQDGSRFALVARNSGGWEIQIFDVSLPDVSPRLVIPVSGEYQDIPNEARVAISPDGNLLAYSIGEDTLTVIDVNTNNEIFQYSSTVESVIFSPANTWLVIRNGHILTLYPTASWKNAVTLNISSPNERGEFAFTPDEQSIAFITASRLKVYSLETLKPIRETLLAPYSTPERNWSIRFLDNDVLRGYGIRWFDFNTRLTLDLLEWNIKTGERLRAETQEIRKPNLLSILWGIPDIEVPSQDNLEQGKLVNFQFVTGDMLIINEEHSACWMNISTGDIRCYKDRDNRVFSSLSGAYRETRQKYSTTLTLWANNELVLSTDPRPVMAVSRDGNFIIMDILNNTTDIYVRRFVLPSISLPGPMTTYGENTNMMAIGTIVEPGLTAITTIQKVPRKVLYQKRGHFIFAPIVMDLKGAVYYLQDNGTAGQVSINVIRPKTFEIIEMMTIFPPAQPNAMAEANGVLAIGMQDGTVLLANPNLQLEGLFQAFHSPIHRIAFSPEGRYLAVAADEGIRVYAVIP
jgi:WD40 repeat protein